MSPSPRDSFKGIDCFRIQPFSGPENECLFFFIIKVDGADVGPHVIPDHGYDLVEKRFDIGAITEKPANLRKIAQELYMIQQGPSSLMMMYGFCSTRSTKPWSKGYANLFRCWENCSIDWNN